ncbi:inter-alpha-trypsin inhibitor heavy chain H3-like protein [Labeo rohita]|uniref:Inter-alpha-trypsin inhibitor heavy chain H3 n=1 Tax=Labeo rohita TaxID=84645 RepID=A0A498LFL9_LABRO|nr:inter-alpha-trypsin inhibitor heavy chain H3-like protein [Labeo rohita]
MDSLMEAAPDARPSDCLDEEEGEEESTSNKSDYTGHVLALNGHKKYFCIFRPVFTGEEAECSRWSDEDVTRKASRSRSSSRQKATTLEIHHKLDRLGSFESLFISKGTEQWVSDTSTTRLLKIEVQSVKVDCKVTSRFAHTVMTTKALNKANVSQEVSFEVELPKTSFITNFSMEIDGKTYTGEVKEKEKAKEQYQKAVASGQTAGLVKCQNCVSQPQIVADIYEPQGIAFVDAYGTFMTNELLPLVEKTVTDKKAHVSFSPTLDQQRKCTECDGTLIDGDFFIKYDVNRPHDIGDIQIVNGYFVHFFAPANLPRVPKMVVFVIDNSYSMVGNKMAQTKEALVTILGELPEEDYFAIIVFSGLFVVWRPHLSKATQENVKAAQEYVKTIQVLGGTELHDAVIHGVEMLYEERRNGTAPKNMVMMIILLTDGEPNKYPRSLPEIQESIRNANDGNITIFSLAFGNDANYGFLDTLSKQNNGLVRRIYEDSDAPLQLAIVADIYEPQGIAFVDAYGTFMTNELLPLVEKTVTDKKAHVSFSPTLDQQRKCTECDGTLIDGDFFIKYDVNRPHDIGDIQIVNGYFVHFFAPANLPRVPKMVVFVIDNSLSMVGNKMAQTREALVTILGELPEEDYFAIIVFSSYFVVWRPHLSKATQENVKAAQEYVKTIEVFGSTELHNAVIHGVEMLYEEQRNGTAPKNMVMMIILLTDGEPNQYPRSLPEIQESIRNANDGNITIFSLAFGNDANYGFLDTLSKQNNGLVRRIYEDSDAPLQLAKVIPGNKINTYFGRFGIIHEKFGIRLMVSTKEISVSEKGKQAKLFWTDTATVKGTNMDLQVIKGRSLTVTLRNSVKFLIILHKVWQKHPYHQDYLGFYTLDSHLFSSNVHGLLGTELHNAVIHGVEMLYEERRNGTAPKNMVMMIILLTDGEPNKYVHFRYPDNTVNSLTKSHFKQLYNGSEIMVAGRLNDLNDIDSFAFEVFAQGFDNNFEVKGQASTQKWETIFPDEEYIFGDFTERLWADKGTPEEKGNATNEALSLSLKYNFVTPLTSMVVTKPEDETRSDTFIADKLTEEERGKPQRYGYTPIQASYAKSYASPTYYVDGDPHFVLELPDQNDTLCFNIDDKPGTIFNLVRDPRTGIVVNGQTIGDKKVIPGNKINTYFGRFGIIHEKFGIRLMVSTKEISVSEKGKQAKLFWTDTATVKGTNMDLQVIKGRSLTVTLRNSVKFLIILHKVWQKHPYHQDYLGFYTLDSHLFSSNVHGLLGQFYHGLQFEVSEPFPGKDPNKPDAVMFVKGKELVVTRGWQRDFRQDMKNGENVPCWFIHNNGNGLLDGVHTDYIVPEVHFHYPDNTVNSLTKSHFKQLYNGSEIMVAGRLNDLNEIDNFAFEVFAQGFDNNFEVKGQANTQKWETIFPDEEYIFGDFTERLWAYLTIQELLNKKDKGTPEEKGNATNEALSLSLKYNFVTPLTSMVVTKPEDETRSDTFIADKLTEEERGKPQRYVIVVFADYTPIQASYAKSYASPTYYVDGDPHFVLELPDQNDTLCFNIDDKPGTIFNLVRDPRTGIVVNGQTIGDKKVIPGNKINTYFGRFGIIHEKFGIRLMVSTKEISVSEKGKQAKLFWTDTATVKGTNMDLQVIKGRSLTVTLRNSVKFLIILHKVWQKHPYHQDYLGFYTLDSHLFSSNVHGLLGIWESVQ